MKLTNYLRDAFVAAAMQAVPKPDYVKLQKDAQDALVKAMSPDVRKVFRKAPKALRWELFYELADRAPVRLVLGDVENHGEVLQPLVEQAKKRNDIRGKLRQVAYGCTTLKQLKEQLPELVAYMPSEGAPAVKNLPAVMDVVADMKSLGWQAAA